MKGTYKVRVQSKKLFYKFEIKRNITIITGDSAKGKTTLVDYIESYDKFGNDSGVSVICDKPCKVVSGANWEKQLKEIKDSIVFIDEGNKFITSKDFAHAVKNSDNYYVLITREKLSGLPYSVNEIYGLRTSGKYAEIKQVYNEIYPLYSSSEISRPERPTLIITEDSNSGNEFFSHVAKINEIRCISAEGKSKVIENIIDRKNENVLIIVDGAAFGPEMATVIKAINYNKNYSLYTPESFEWLLLMSDIFRDFAFSKEIKEMLSNPSEFIESKDYFSWERYFTEFLTAITKNLKGYEYSKKGNLKEWYKRPNNVSKVVDIIDIVDLK